MTAIDRHALLARMDTVRATLRDLFENYDCDADPIRCGACKAERALIDVDAAIALIRAEIEVPTTAEPITLLGHPVRLDSSLPVDEVRLVTTHPSSDTPTLGDA